MGPRVADKREPLTASRQPSADVSRVALGDGDLRLQAWCVEHLHCLPAPGLPAEIAAGVVALVRVIFARCDSPDAAAARRWCNLSAAGLAVQIGRHKKTITGWLAAARSIGWLVDSPDPDHAQRLRHMPGWSVLLPLAHDAACAGKIPGPPLFVSIAAEPVPGTGSGTGGVAPPVFGTGSETGGTTPPVFEKPEALRLRFADADLKNIEILGGGVGGVAPFKGGFPPTPTRPGENRRHYASGSTETGGITPPVYETRGEQLLLDFARRSSESEARLHVKVDDLARGQARMLTLLDQIVALLTAPGGKRSLKSSQSPAPRSKYPEPDLGPPLDRERQRRAEQAIDRMSAAEVLSLAAATGERETNAAYLRVHPTPAMILRVVEGQR